MPSHGRAGGSVASERIFTTLRERIIALELPPGCRLTEAELSREFGVSATPVREALQRLVQAGLADHAKARGVTVHRPTSREIREIFEMRAVLEPAALRLSIPHFSREDWEETAAIVSQASEALALGRIAELGRLNFSFHVKIVSRADNMLMLSTLRDLADRRRLISLHGWALDHNSMNDWRDHLAILERGRTGDVDGSARLLAEHIRRFAAATLAALGEGDRLRQLLNDRRNNPNASSGGSNDENVTPMESV